MAEQRRSYKRAQTGQVRNFGSRLVWAGKCPASNMTHTELPSALSAFCWCRAGKSGLCEFSHAQDASGLPSNNHLGGYNLSAVLRRMWGCGGSWEAPAPWCDGCPSPHTCTGSFGLCWVIQHLPACCFSLQLRLLESVLSRGAAAAGETQSQPLASSPKASKKDIFYCCHCNYRRAKSRVGGGGLGGSKLHCGGGESRTGFTHWKPADASSSSTSPSSFTQLEIDAWKGNRQQNSAALPSAHQVAQIPVAAPAVGGSGEAAERTRGKKYRHSGIPFSKKMKIK